MKHHPIAELFPMFPDDQLQELADSIKKEGLLEKGVTHKGQLIDGRNREAACKIARVKFETKEYRGSDPLGYVLSHNLNRRHLTVAERATIAAKIANMKEGRPKTTPNGGVSKITQTEAAEKLGVSPRSVQRAAAAAKPAKKEPKDPKSWTLEDLKKDDELMDCFTAIAAVYGNEDTKAIRTGLIGLKRADVTYLAKLPKEKMLECRDLIMANHWTPKVAFAFVNRMATEMSTVEDLINWCLATKAKFFTADFLDGGFTVTCKANRASQRKH